MPSSSSQRTRTALASPPPPVRWRVWYLADHPGGAIVWVLLLAAVWALVVWVTGRGYLGWFAVGLLVLGSWRLWTPIRYELTPEGIQQAIGPLRWTIAWKTIGRYELADAGVWLFPKPLSPAGDRDRGMYLPWAGYRQQVLSHLQYYLGPTPAGPEGA